MLGIKITVNKTQEFVINVQALLDTPAKWIQGAEDRVSTCEDQPVGVARQMGYHSKELQALRMETEVS